MRVAFILLGATCLASCGFSERWEGRAISTAGAGVILDEGLRPYDERHLIQLIGASTGDADTNLISETPFKVEQTLATKLGHFANRLYTGPTPVSSDALALPTETEQNRLRDARNQIQGVLMTRSGNMCNAFKQRLRFQSTTIAFGLGTAAVLFGSAGALLTGGASQALAAAAGAATGTQAEYDRDFLSGLTTSVIIPGIDRQRTAIQQEIVDRRCLGVSSYTLSQALLDVTRFHAACSTDVGVAVAASAISQSRTTSLEAAKAAIDAVLSLQASANAIGAGGKGAGGAPAKPGDGKIVAAPPLLGDPINFLQCRPLDADGMLPADIDPILDGRTIRPPQAATRTSGSPAPALASNPAPSSGPVTRSTPARPESSSRVSRDQLLLAPASPFRGQFPYGSK